MTITPKYDIVKRKNAKEISINSSNVLGEYYYYAKYGDHATNRISSIRYGDKTSGSYAIGDNLKYTYDSIGNITKVYENGELSSSYEYDSLNRLIRENNTISKETILHTYDNNGNILSKKIYAYSVKPIEEISGDKDEFRYYYENSSDRLIQLYSKVKNTSGTYEEKTKNFEYDLIGNPIVYKGINLANSWTKGRQLTSFNGISFSYNGQGQRIAKGAITYTYDSSGNMLKQSNGLEYIYDESGVRGLIKDGLTYLYRKNAQGDVIALLDSAGTIVVKYKYDAWGKHVIYGYTNGNLIVDANKKIVNLATSSAHANHIGNQNPIRYRSYYYDTETGWYLLSTRYYDPEIGRFINADDVEVATTLGAGVINGLNLYAYCGNNPVNVTDSTGYFWDYVLDAVFLVWSIADVIKNPGDWKNWAALGVDLVFAVIPFVPSGAGQAIKMGNRVDNMMDLASTMNKLDNLHDFSEITVIGQSMNRVQDVGRAFNSLDNLYDGFSGYSKMSKMGSMGKVGAEVIGKGQNAAWLFGKLRKGYTVLDIGVDMAKVAKGIKSSSYVMERVIMMIWRTRNIWKLPLNYYL